MVYQLCLGKICGRVWSCMEVIKLFFFTADLWTALLEEDVVKER